MSIILSTMHSQLRTKRPVVVYRIKCSECQATYMLVKQVMQ